MQKRIVDMGVQKRLEEVDDMNHEYWLINVTDKNGKLVDKTTDTDITKAKVTFEMRNKLYGKQQSWVIAKGVKWFE